MSVFIALCSNNLRAIPTCSVGIGKATVDNGIKHGPNIWSMVKGKVSVDFFPFFRESSSPRP
jgi:hypothetical protein